MGLEAQEIVKCPICGNVSKSIGAVPFDRNNKDVPIVNSTPMEYYKCTDCYFLFCPEMLTWSSEDLGREVYNNDYVKYDPDYIENRPKNWASIITANIDYRLWPNLRNLDYGSGTGKFSEVLNSKNIYSVPYDPYSNNIRPSEKFNFITSIEVFEHALDINKTISDIKSFLTDDGVIIFTTLLSNKNTDINWWYIGARNGHISILSEKSLKILATNNGLFFQSIDQNIHVLQKSRSNLKNILGWVLPRGK